MGELLAVIVMGAIVGALARFFLPGRQPMGVLVTVVVGIVGAIAGNYIGEALSPDGTMHWILAVLAAIGLVLLWGAVTGRRVTH